MSDKRYGHSNVGGGDQDQDERKDDGWQRRQGGSQSRDPGRGRAPERPHTRSAEPVSQGTNTQGGLAGIGDAADRSTATLRDGRAAAESSTGARARDARSSGTDQAPRMGGPLGGDAEQPHLPEGAQDNDERGSGAGGFDRGVDATNVGAVHQGVRVEDDVAAK